MLAAGFYAARTDFKGMIIPNKISLIIVGLFVIHALFLSVAGYELVYTLKSHIFAGIVVFAVTFGMFAAKLLGGGDAKMLSAYSLWFGMQGVSVFIFYTALFGAVLGCVALYLKKKKPIDNPAEGGWVQRVQAGENAVPYAIPILAGAVIAFVWLGYFAPDRLAAFL